MKGKRDLDAARAAGAGLLASIGLIALLAWIAARYLAEFAVGPIELYEPVGRDPIEQRDFLAWLTWQFRNQMAGTAVMLVWFALAYWLLAYLLGAARLPARARSGLAGPTVLLGAGLAIGMVVAFFGTAPRIIGPTVDACVRRLAVDQPELALSSAGIHGCEARASNWAAATFLLSVLGLMGLSLWRRYRLRDGNDGR